MIPKKIHYCWFGGKPLPVLAIRCIQSWKKYFPDYEIIQWNEENYDIKKNQYIKEAYDAKKYAFVSDYARFDLLYQFGGLYFDTDVEIIKDMSSIVANGNFMGMEIPGRIAAGLGIGAEKGLPIFSEIMESYNNSIFKKEDGKLDETTVVDRVTEIYKKHGFISSSQVVCNQQVCGFTIYLPEYFCPKSISDFSLNITKNTYSIHHYDGSWVTGPTRRLIEEKKWISRNIHSHLISIFLIKLCVLKKIIFSLFVK